MHNLTALVMLHVYMDIGYLWKPGGLSRRTTSHAPEIAAPEKSASVIHSFGAVWSLRYRSGQMISGSRPISAAMTRSMRG